MPARPSRRRCSKRPRRRWPIPLALFKLPPAAGCKSDSAKVEIEREHDHDAKDHAKADSAAHSDFDAEYTLECASPEALTSIDFQYFKAFPNARELGVMLITPKGQTKLEATRAKPRLDLAGMM